jgi:4a-hydroxytetrahydrobiopterin dehydratase
MKVLAELAGLLEREPLWRFVNGKLTRTWSFKDFGEAMAFVNRVAGVAEEAGHHPDIDIRYNKVTLGLVTHDAGGVTEKDAEMAQRLSREFPV